MVDQSAHPGIRGWNRRAIPAFARIENHFFVNGGFFERPNQLIEDADRIAHIPTVIIHGRYDVICPVRNAWELHAALPDSELHIIPDAGHAMSEPGITDALIEATDRFALRSSN
ncbi:MAG: hypothetical protein R2848_08550 [Thermomicrobiales bacterium]